MKTIIKVLCVCAAAFVLPAKAQDMPAVASPAGRIGTEEQADGRMTLKDCMAFAVSNATKMRILAAETGDARIARRDAVLALFTPQINASTYAYYNFGRSIDPQTNTYFTQTSFHNNYGISAGFDLFDGFRAVNNLRISKTGLLISASQEKQAEADICLAVMEAYYNVLYYKNLVDVYEDQVATTEAALRKAEREEELGRKGHADVVQMEASLAECQYDLTNARNAWRSQLMTLSDLMFWPLEEELAVDTTLPDWEAEPVSTEAVVDFALDHDPALRVAGWRVENARRELSTAKWQLLPSVGLYAGWNTSYYTYAGAQTDPFNRQFRNNGGEYVQLSVSVPIFNRLQGHSRIAMRRNALTRAAAEYDQKRREVESEVRRAVQDRDGAAFAWRQARRKADVHEEAYALNRKKLDQGMISPLEFQMAAAHYLKARADEMNSLFSYLIRQAVVRYYGGVDYLDQ